MTSFDHQNATRVAHLLLSSHAVGPREYTVKEIESAVVYAATAVANVRFILEGTPVRVEKEDRDAIIRQVRDDLDNAYQEEFDTRLVPEIRWVMPAK